MKPPAARARFEVDGARFEELLSRLPASARERVDDVYLAFACAEGAPGALEALDAQVLEPLLLTLSRTYGDAVAQDALQQVRAQLLVPGASGRGIAQYRGRGPLAAWLKIIAVRLAARHAATDGKRAPRELADAGAGGSDEVDLALLKRSHGRDVREAFASAIEGLEQRERLLLKLSVVEGLSVDRIAKVLGKPRTSVHRWLAQARSRLAAAALERLNERLRLSPTESRSLIRHLNGELDLSVGRLLG